MNHLLQIKKENLLYMLIATLLFVGGYAFLRYSYKITDNLPFAQEIVLVVLGTIVTILITAILLNKQTEVELKKEENIKFLELKTNIYTQLLEYLEKVMLKNSTSDEDLIRLRFLTHKLAIVASPAVLIQYEKFVHLFIKTTKDHKLEKQETNLLSEELAKLTVKIREDLVGQLDKESSYSQFQISKQILANTESLMENNNE